MRCNKDLRVAIDTWKKTNRKSSTLGLSGERTYKTYLCILKADVMLICSWTKKLFMHLLASPLRSNFHMLNWAVLASKRAVSGGGGASVHYRHWLKMENFAYV